MAAKQVNRANVTSVEERVNITSAEKRAELDTRCMRDETVIPGGTGGKSLKAHVHLVQGQRTKGMTRKGQLGTKEYQEMGGCGGQTRKEHIGIKGYREMGHNGGLSTMDGSDRAEIGSEIDESKFKNPCGLQLQKHQG